MENNTIICPVCNSEINRTSKFCTKCGAKNEQYNGTTVDASVDSSAIDSKCETMQESIIKNEVPNMSINENQQKNDTQNAPSKKSKKAVILSLGIVVALVAVIALCSVVFASPNKTVNTAITNTYKSLLQNKNDFNNSPTFFGLLSRSENCFEKELALYYEDMDLGYYYDTQFLEGFGAKIKLQLDKKNSASNLNLSLNYDKEDFVSAMLSLTNENIVIHSPELLDNAIGLNIKSIIDNLGEYQSLEDFSEIISKQIELSNNAKLSIEKILSNLNKDLDEIIKYEKDESNKKLYVATITEEQLDSLLIKYCEDLAKDDAIKKFCAFLLYLDDEMYEDLSYYEEEVEEDISDFLDNLKDILDSIDIDNIKIEVEVPNKKSISYMEITTNFEIKGERFKLKFNVDVEQNKNLSDYTAKLTFNSDYDQIIFKLNENFEVVGNETNRIINFDTNISDEEANLSLKETLNKKEKTTSTNIELQADSEYLAVSIDGNYTSNDTLNFDDLEIILNSYYDNMSMNFSGYLTSKKINNLDKIDTANIKYINDMDNYELDDLGYSIGLKFYNILRKLGLGIEL